MTLAGGVLQDFLGTISIISLVAVVYGIVLRFSRSSGLAQGVLGLAFGGVSIHAMFDPIVVADGLIADMRNVPVALAGAFLGPVGGFIATAMAVAMRYWIGGVGAPSGVAGLILAGLAGLAWSRWTVVSGRCDARALAVLAAMVSVHWAGVVLLPPEAARHFLVSVLPAFLPLELLGLATVGALLERERRQEDERRRLALVADSDPLTGLLNRRGFARAVGRPSNRQGGALLMLDLDHFKRINDAYGHPAGDAVLRALGARLSRVLSSNDILARLGGEELAVYLPGQTPKAARDTARRLCESIRGEPFALPQGDSVAVTVSIGGAWGGERHDLDSLFLRADSALYAAKNAGRDRCRFAPEGQGAIPDALAAEAACGGCPLRGACACDARLLSATLDAPAAWRAAAA